MLAPTADRSPVATWEGFMGPLTTLKRWSVLLGLAGLLSIAPAVLSDGGLLDSGVARADDDDDDDRSRSSGDSSGSAGTSSTGGRGSGGGWSGGGWSGGGRSGGGSTSGGSTGGSASAGAGSGGSGARESSDRSSDDSSRGASGRRIWNKPTSAALGGLAGDDNLVPYNTGSWWQLPNAHAVRDEILAYDVPVAALGELEAAGFKLLEQRVLGGLGFALSRLRVPSGRSLRSALSAAGAIAPGVVFEPNLVYETASRPGPENCTADGCYGRRLLGWQAVPETCGSGIRIGMTDTAIDPDHPALRGRAVRTENFDPLGEGSLPDHGTAVAGLLVGDPAAGFPGMLPGAGLFAADVFHTNESGESYSTLASLIEGFEWLVGEEVSVINVSMTGPPSTVLEMAVDRLDDHGIVLVAAAGNGGPSARPAFPAAYGDVISVTAVDAEMRPYRMANRGPYIAFASPGVGIWSADAAGAGQHRTGTSFAAAHAAAVIADVIEREGDDPIHEAIAALQSSAHDLGAPGKDPIFGWGLIQGVPSCQR
ncbi:MAG: S8 family serine peptidase [Inquilinus sp.]|nr:S8 family serine peptidase [Inquilinus sp.]